jgi:hypothetical protein
MPRDEHPRRTGRHDGAREIGRVKSNARSTVHSLVTAMRVVDLTRAWSAAAVALSAAGCYVHAVCAMGTVKGVVPGSIGRRKSVTRHDSVMFRGAPLEAVSNQLTLDMGNEKSVAASRRHSARWRRCSTPTSAARRPPPISTGTACTLSDGNPSKFHRGQSRKIQLASHCEHGVLARVAAVLGKREKSPTSTPSGLQRVFCRTAEHGARNGGMVSERMRE